VLDLARADIARLEQLSDEELTELMNNPEGPFAVIKMNNSPTWFPPQFVWNDPGVRARAVGRLPKQTLMGRANALKQLRSDGQVGNNLIQRVQRLYPKSSLKRIPDYHADMAGRAANDNAPSRAFRLPNERIFSLFRILKSVNQIENRHYKEAARLLRDIEPTDDEFRENFDRIGFWRSAVARAQAIRDACDDKARPVMEDLCFMIEWLADDISPEALPEKDRIRVNALKSAMLNGADNAHTMTVERFERELDAIENDPAAFEKLVGSGPDAQEKWGELKRTYLSYAARMARSGDYVMTEEKREALRAYRRSTNGGPGIRFG
jgi:hypothetical protein